MTGSAFIPLKANQIRALRCTASVRTVNLRGIKGLVDEEGIRRLEGLKLIQQVPDPDYPRFKRHEVTDAGVAWLVAYDKANDEIISQIAEDAAAAVQAHEEKECQSPTQTSSSTA